VTSRIRLLPDDLVNRIAAGEVVERPGSILKELVENSLDAGADRVEVEAEAGGKRLIRVSDNGSGMNEEELLVCLERHATSKLGPDSDLTDIGTLGFRGEALPAIASVSRLTIVSSQGGSEGRKVTVEGGRIAGVSPAPANKGTTVEVRDVFFNTPARRKFLKSVPTEEAHLADACQRYALSRPGLAISLVSDGRELLRTAQGDGFPARLREACGPHASRFREFSWEGSGVSVRGALGGPEHSGRSGAGLFVFVLGRPVRDKLLLRAVSQGYGRTLQPGRYPAGAVFIDLDPSEVDVNVHPAKTEVRFRRPGTVFSSISQAVERAVTAPLSVTGGSWDPGGPGSGDGLPEDGWDAPGPGAGPAYGGGAGDRGADHLGGGGGGVSGARAGGPGGGLSSRPVWTGPTLPRPSGGGLPGYGPPGSAGGSAGGPDPSGPAAPGAPPGVPGAPAGPCPDSGLGLPLPAAPGPQAPAAVPRPDLPGPGGARACASPGILPESGPRPLRPIAQLARTYILCEAPDGLRIVDQHAAHERIVFNRLRAALERDGLPSQNVLLPEAFELHPHERAALERLQAPLGHMGFRLEPFGGDTWILKGIPKILTQQAAAEALREILSAARGSYSQLDGAGTGETVREVSEAWLHTVACRAAVKAGHDLSLEEMEKLLADMAEAEAGGFCPHGRPSSLSITYAELEKRFGRK
jgi:DNA mismatch repair protein MutL